jgi:hypothetical protein
VGPWEAGAACGTLAKSAAAKGGIRGVAGVCAPSGWGLSGLGSKPPRDGAGVTAIPGARARIEEPFRSAGSMAGDVPSTVRRRGHPRQAVLAGVLAVAAAVAVAGCGSWKPPVTPGVVEVVAGENFWGSIAAQIGGRHVRITSILSSPAADPYLYEANVANAIAVAEAGLVIENGAGYDTFVSQLLGVTTHPGRAVASMQQVLGATGPEVNLTSGMTSAGAGGGRRDRGRAGPP